MDKILETAVISDAAEIHELRKKAFGKVGDEIGRYDLPLLMQTLEDVGSEFSQSKVFKYVVKGKIIGSITGTPDNNFSCTVGKLAVDPEVQHSGIGTGLMNAVEKEFPECVRFKLFTSRKTPYTIKMYKKLGYFIDGEDEMNGMPIVLMSKNTAKYIFKSGPEHHEALIGIWEESVRASHYFITEEDIHLYRGHVGEALRSMDIYNITDEYGRMIGFTGIDKNKIEMLFITPEASGNGYGSRLMKYVIAFHNISQVDVNEQNHKAALFYKKYGFTVTGRSEKDPSGNPYPILHMERKK